jgi:uncharacterized protein with HEPN domain
MSKQSDIVPLGDMLDYSRRVINKTAHISRADFDSDETFSWRSLICFKIIGEAGGLVSRAMCDRHPEIDWPNIVSMRNRIVHDYRHIDIDVVWETATIDVPLLLAALEAFLPSDPP